MIATGAVAGEVSPDVAWRIYCAMLDAVGADSSEVIYVPRTVAAA
jgi:hypothetical protein